MASVYDLKPRFVSRPLRPVASGKPAARISANQVTLAAAALSCALGLPLLACSRSSCSGCCSGVPVPPAWR